MSNDLEDRIADHIENYSFDHIFLQSVIREFEGENWDHALIKLAVLGRLDVGAEELNRTRFNRLRTRYELTRVEGSCERFAYFLKN